MKSKLVSSIILTFLLLLILSVEVFAWGPITHMTLLDDIINDPRLNPDIKKVLQENLRYAKGGAMGPDLFYFSDKRFADIAHYCSTNSLATAMLNTAKKTGKSQTIAYAYGWIIHVAADPIEHKWVNSIAGGEYDPNNSAIKRTHREIELSIDTLNNISHNYTLSNMFYDGTYKTIAEAYKSLYGCSKNAPSIQDYKKADNLLFAVLSNYSAMQRNPYKYNTPEYQKAYKDSIDTAIRALNSSGASLLNYDLDSGFSPEDGIKYTGDQKCKNQCQLDKYCAPTPASSPGGDHPDDTVSVDSGNSTSEEVSLDSLYRLAVKKNKKWILWQKALEDANAEYEALPSDASPELKQEKLNNISALINMLNDPFDIREFTINNPQFSTENFEVPDIAVLENGYFENTTGLINKWKEPVRTVTLNFSPEIVKNNPVMVIPSGGLYGLENSVMLKAQFAEYVKQGGTLIVFAQQHGYEFSVLPVPQEADGTYKTITGYGWTEDQSCLWNGTYIDTYHQILSAISTSTVSANVDGYFTSYPSNSTILLRRTVNGQPAMLTYEYGQGRVIVSSMYSDWGYAHSQATKEEIALVRDMISWAKKPETLPEIKPGETLSVNVSLTNNSTRDAASAKLLIYDSDRKNLLKEEMVSTFIPAGSPTQLTTQYSAPTTAFLGIYHIDYELYDANGIIVQPQSETDSGRFVVSNPPSTLYVSPDLNFAVNSDNEYYAYGSDAVFTVTMWNNGDTDRTITAKYYAYHLNVTGSPKTMTVLAHSSTSFQVIASNITWEGWLVVKFYDETNKYLGERWKGIWMVYPSANVTVQTDKTLYAKGETVTINTSLKNNTPANWQSDVKITITDPQNTNIFEDTKTVALSSYGTGTVATSFILPTTLAIGTYTVKAEAYYGTSLISSGSTSFQLPQSQIAVTQNLPSAFTTGTNTVSFALSNTGKISVSSGTLDIFLKDPDGIIIYTGSLPFSIAVGESKTMDVPVNILSLKFGKYTLIYTQSDETKTGSPTTTSISNSASAVFSFDRVSCKVREIANLSLSLTNTGKFKLENVSVTVSVADTGYTATRTINIGQSQALPLQFTIPIPETTAPGQHDVNVTVTLPSGSSVAQSTKFTVPESSLSIGYSGSITLTAGNTINLTIENTGGVDTTYTTEKLSITDNKGVLIYQGNVSGTILAGERKILTTIQIPSQAAQEVVFLSLQVKDNKTLKMSDLNRIFEITGLLANLQTRTDKDAYFKTEAITGISSILNGQFRIEAGSLKVSVSRMKPTGTGQFTHFLPKTGWWSFFYPYGVTVSFDGSLYVADSGNCRIVKFDSNGNFITKWGSYGTGDGQFAWPKDVAIGPDGSVYVADTNNHRIQKFDNNGNFTTKWGSYGPGDGQFSGPYGIAVAPDGSIYVTDSGNHRIQKFDSNGNFITKWGSYGSGDGQLSAPWGITVDNDSFVYVADTGNNRIQKFDSNGNFITKWGSYGSGDGQFYWPAGISVAPDGSLYVVDRINSRIQLFDSNGNFIIKWGSLGIEDGKFSNPSGIAVTLDGSVYVTDTGTYTNCIQKFDSKGNFITRLGTSSNRDGKFKYPSGIAIAHNGSIYVADYGNYRVQKFANNGNFLTKWGSLGLGDGQFRDPFDIAVAYDNFVYVTDSQNSRIQKFDSNGNFITKWGSYGSGNGQFKYPYGIAIGPDGLIYVVDKGNCRIQKFDNNGNYIGKWGSCGTGNGQFGNLWDITVSPDGYVYVIEDYNHRVQKFDSNGNFIIKWGSWGWGDGQFSEPWGITTDSDGFVYVSDYYTNYIQKFDSNGNFIKKWGGYGTEDGQFNEPCGITFDTKGSIYVTDSDNHRVQKMVVSNQETLFDTTIPINQSANISHEYTTFIGKLSTTGKHYFEAELQNSLGQTIAKSEYPFYVIEGNTVLLFSSDKKIYKPGEIVTITGEVRNLAPITASALSLQLSAISQNIYTATFDVPANGSYPFTITTTTSTEGTYNLTGKVTQNNSTLVEINDQYEVANPKVTTTVSAPEVVGNESFNINVEVKNEGKVNATIDARCMMQDASIDTQTITIPAGETRLIQYSQQIMNNTTYTFMFTGDLNQTITKTVSYGLAASITISPQTIYPEGRIAVPVTVTNTGQLDISIDSRFTIHDASNNIIHEVTKTYYIPKGGSVTDTLYFDLTEGNYQLSAISYQPSATASASFSVKKENKVEMTVSVGVQANDLIPATANITNLGYNSIGGSIRYTVVSSQNAAVWSGDTAVSELLPQNSQLITFNINPAAIAIGNYTLKVELLNNSGQQIAVQSLPITIQGSIFQITQLPPYQTFYVGQEAMFTFKVKNIGNQEGAFDFNLKAYDLIDSTQREWLKPGEEKSITFSFMLPEDLEEKDYFVNYRLGDSPDSTVLQAGKSGTVPTRGQVKYHIEGINLNVNATLDKQYYKEGDDARLTIPVSTRNPQLPTLNLFARVNYNGYESQQTFTLSGSQTLTFDIPLTQITGEKLFYGIYHESGRSIHLNSLYIYKAGDVITITTDKQVYNPGGTVSVAVNSVSGITNGTMTLSGPNYTETIAFTGTATRSFILPATMTAGTYNISCQLSAVGGETYTANHPIDVAGIQVKVLECKNDKGKYASSDTITANFTISSNKAMPAILKAWIVDPEGKYISGGENSINLSSSDPLLFTDHYSLTTAVSGIHRLVYGIYSGDLLLVSGSEAFDVGDAVLLGISTDKTDYPTNAEPVNVKVSMYGTVDANLELQLDRTTVETQSVSLNGFTTLDIELGIVKPGTHVLKGILTSGGLRSTKETSFVYGSSLPDLAAGVRSQDTKVRNDNTIKIVATVTNQGKTPSNTTTIAFYDGDPELVSGLIETKPINALNSGESQEIIIIWNVLGKAGEHTIKAIADPDNSVIEFNEDNNAATTNILIPDIILITETDKGTYKIRQKVNITSTITSLTSAKTYNNLILFTSAKDSAGTEVYQNSTMIDILQPSSSTQRTETWNTSGLPVDGVYTITQTIISDPQLLAQSSKLIALEKAPDFTIRTDKDYQKIKQGEKATYTVYIEPLNGWNSEVPLRIEGLPEGTSVSFSPCNPIPPGDVLIAIITTDTTPAGTYALNLIAEGIDEGEVITHTLPLTTDASGFGLEVNPSNQTIKQLEGATFNISLLSMNEYEGEINLSIDGLPYGVNASFEKSTSHVPGNVKLTVQTSKYVRPGTYTFSITGDDGLVEHTIEITLNINANPEIASGIISTQGPGPNNEAWVRLFNSTIQPVFDLIAFDTKYGANVTSADIDGDGYDEIVVSQGPDPKNTATLRVFKRDGTTVTEYTAFDSKYGLTISSADLDGDWLDELIVGMGPDPKNPAQLRILKYNGNGFTEIMTQTIYIDLKYGLNTATGDIDGDGLLEIIAAPGPGPNNPAVITVWKDTGGYLTELYTFTAFEGNYGANISTGDIDGDRKAEIITGTGPDPKNPSIVRVFKSDGSLMLELRPYDNKYGYGVTIASTDLDEDGIDEIITGLGFGPQNAAWMKLFKADGTEITSFLAYPENIGYGVKVSTCKTGE